MPRLLTAVLAAAFIAMGCGGGDGDEDTSPHYDPYASADTNAQAATGNGGTAEGADTMAVGKQVYKRHCLMCHQGDGSGVPGMQPPLQDSPSLEHDTEDAIRRVLFGVQPGGKGPGPRSEYTNIMPPMAYLSDAQVASVLTYARATFADSGKPVTPGQVAEIRKRVE
ncbi:MAG: c-type cytochrome [Candidatus Hydrogenedentota bacterium]